MRAASTYTVPGGVEIAIRTEHPELIEDEVAKVAAGTTVLTLDHQMGILQALRDALEELGLERVRRLAFQLKLEHVDGLVTEFWGQLEVLGELARKDVKVEQADDVLKDWPEGRIAPVTGGDPIDEVMRDAG